MSGARDQSRSGSATTSGGEIPVSVKKKSQKDFKFGREIGTGSFSTVYLAREVDSGMEVAVKVLEKSNVLRHKATKNAVWMERHVLQSSDHPLVARLIASFQDDSRLYFVLPYAPYGELLRWLHRAPDGCFDVETVRFYTSELLLALEYLHSRQIVHRDIKPENMLLGPKFHLMLVDFGSAIVLNNPEIKAVSFTGTPQFVSPEMLGGLRNVINTASGPTSSSSSDGSGSRSQNGEESSVHETGATTISDEGPVQELMYLMDFWAFGCVLYQLLCGNMPFRSSRPGYSDVQEFELFHKVLNIEYEFPDNFPDAAAKDMVSRLLVLEPQCRLGNPTDGGHDALKYHPFLSSVNWNSGTSALMERTPPNSMLNLINASKQSSCRTDSSSNSGASVCEVNRSPEWSGIPVGFEAGQRYQWDQEAHRNSSLSEKSNIGRESCDKTLNDESLIDIEGGGLVKFLVKNQFCFSSNNDIMMPRKDLYLSHQRANNPYDQFTQGRLILDYGILYKRRKLRARKRMFIMVEDIRLLYVDPDAMELKGIVKLSALSTFELRNSKTFLIRTPGRDYILEDPCECAHEWVERVKRYWSLFFRSPT